MSLPPRDDFKNNIFLIFLHSDLYHSFSTPTFEFLILLWKNTDEKQMLTWHFKRSAELTLKSERTNIIVHEYQIWGMSFCNPNSVGGKFRGYTKKLEGKKNIGYCIWGSSGYSTFIWQTSSNIVFFSCPLLSVVSSFLGFSGLRGSGLSSFFQIYLPTSESLIKECFTFWIRMSIWKFLLATSNKTSLEFWASILREHLNFLWKDLNHEKCTGIEGDACTLNLWQEQNSPQWYRLDFWNLQNGSFSQNSWPLHIHHRCFFVFFGASPQAF